MKKKAIVIFPVLLLFFIAVTAYGFLRIPNGQTRESREQLLSDIPKGSNWQISLEREVKGYIVSGIYSTAGKNGIAVFEPIGNGKYRLSSRALGENNRIIFLNYVFDNVCYDIVWFNGAQTRYAEITYTIDGIKQAPIKHDSTNKEIFIKEAPSKDYSIHIVYYDSNGNMYE